MACWLPLASPVVEALALVMAGCDSAVSSQVLVAAMGGVEVVEISGAAAATESALRLKDSAVADCAETGLRSDAAPATVVEIVVVRVGFGFRSGVDETRVK